MSYVNEVSWICHLVVQGFARFTRSTGGPRRAGLAGRILRLVIRYVYKLKRIRDPRGVMDARTTSGTEVMEAFDYSTGLSLKPWTRLLTILYEGKALPFKGAPFLKEYRV